MSQGPVGSGMPCAVTGRGVEESPDGALYDFEQLSAVADAVLYEGYLLYPYRRSSAKNRVRWQFGVLFPRDWVESEGPVVPGVSGSADSWYQRTECLLRIRRPDACVRVRVRYLQVQCKQVQETGRDGDHITVESLRTDDGTVHLTFDEAVPREADVTVCLDDLLQREHTVPVGAAGGVDIEPLPGHAGRLVRRREELRASTTVIAERLSPPSADSGYIPRTRDPCRIRGPRATRRCAVRSSPPTAWSAVKAWSSSR